MKTTHRKKDDELWKKKEVVTSCTKEWFHQSPKRGPLSQIKSRKLSLLIIKMHVAHIQSTPHLNLPLSPTKLRCILSVC